MALSDSFVKKEFTPIEQQENLDRERAQAYLEEAGLEGRETDKLRKTMLSSEEAVAAKDEELTNVRQRRGLKKDWGEFLDIKRRMGLVLHHSEFLYRLRKIIPQLTVARGLQRNRLGLYTFRNTPTDEIKDYLGRKKFIDCPIYLGWIDLGYLPEYEIDIVNDVGVAVGQRRSYRTVLLNMIARRHRCERCGQGEKARPMPCPWTSPGCGWPASIITERQAESVFGQPTNGATASWYRMRLYDFRNGR